MLLLAAVWLCLGGSSSAVSAQTLFGAAHTGSLGPRTLYQINPTTGVATAVGPIGFEDVSAMDFHPVTGVLYAIGYRPGTEGAGSGDAVLITINPVTGAGTEVAFIGNEAGTFPDMSFRPSDNTLFAWCECSDDLYTINLTTGTATLVGDSEMRTGGSALAFSSGNTLFFANRDSNLYTINQMTGAATVSVAMTGFGSKDSKLNSMDFHPVTGVLFGIDNQGEGGSGPNVLTTVDTTTGVVTTIGMTQNGMDALAWQPVLFPNPTLGVQVGDPAVCLDPGGLVGVTATVTNPNNMAQPASFTANLPAGLTTVPGTCVADVNPGGCTLTNTSVSWNGMLPANTTVTIIYRARIGAGVASGAQLCIANTGTVAGVAANLNYCFNVVCPLTNTRVSDQKAGSVIVFPYYTSTIGGGSDTRMTISNISSAASSVANQAYVHLFFIDGTSCQASDLFLCLTPNASFSFKASEYDPGNTGYLIAVAVDNQGLPTRNNVLIGNAFVNTPTLADNYGAESFWANAFAAGLYTQSGSTATLYFDHTGYDAVPKQFAVEIQSPLEAAAQQVITAGLSGDLTTSSIGGAAQIGTGQAFNEKEVFGSFNSWLLGTCQAKGTISTATPRVPNGLGNLIKMGQAGYLKFNVGGAVGLLLTPRGGAWTGIRTLHKTQTVATTLTIPIFVPVC